MNRFLTLFVVLTLALAPIACSNSKEKARAKLAAMRVAYSELSFVERAGSGDTMAVELFLMSGMNVNAQGRDGKTALIAAAESGRVPLVELLLANGADINAKDKKFQATALLFAAARSHAEMVKVLLGKGADTRARETKQGMTALLSAAMRGDRTISQMLVE